MNTIVVTGATSGIGFAVSREMLNKGYRLIGTGRSIQSCDKAAKLLAEEFPEADLIFFPANLMHLTQVTYLAEEINAYLAQNCEGRLFALINNAGCVCSHYTTSEDGYEQQFSLNYLSAFLLTYHLFPSLIKGNGRILITSSNSHKMMKMHWKDIMYQRRYNPLMVYKQSKLCNLLFAHALNRRLSGCPVRAYGIDPGLVNTDIGLKNNSRLTRLVWSVRRKKGVSPEVPAKIYARVCGQKHAPDGFYYAVHGETAFSRQVNDENAERLFALSERLCGISYDRMFEGAGL
ncbi:MAG: SDR family NAD(P)-dependent oxidoreductase [Clostridiales bacterium]|nr:SDR family NAD(P)-dependent oxidoreductase [Clostridiales bacterium]